MYTSNLINNQWYGSSATNEGVYGVWISNWSLLAQRIFASAVTAEAHGNIPSAQSGYLRAFSYWFLAQWPAPAFNDGFWSSEDAAKNATMSFDNALRLMENLYYIKQFSVSFSSGSYHDVSLPVIFMSPDPSHALPTLFLTTGTDFPKVILVIRGSKFTRKACSFKTVLLPCNEDML